MKYYEVENGEMKSIKEILEERNELLYERLSNDEMILLNEYNTKKKAKVGSRFTQCIFAELSKELPMSRADFVQLDHEDLHAYYTAYMGFLRHYNIFDVPSTRQLFCAFMGITVVKFIDLLKSNDTDIQEMATMINDSFDGMIFAQAESSSNNSTATLTRARTKYVGQGHQRASEDISFNVVEQANPQILMERAKQIYLETQSQRKE